MFKDTVHYCCSESFLLLFAKLNYEEAEILLYLLGNELVCHISIMERNLEIKRLIFL